MDGNDVAQDELQWSLVKSDSMKDENVLDVD
jgi:hypothetical protein